MIQVFTEMHWYVSFSYQHSPLIRLFVYFIHDPKAIILEENI